MLRARISTRLRSLFPPRLGIVLLLLAAFAGLPLRLGAILLLLATFAGLPLPQPAQAGTPRLPLSEEVSVTTLGDEDQTNGFPEKQDLIAPLGPGDDPFAGVLGSNVTNDKHGTFAVALGDVDGDGDLDVVAGNYNQPNRLYLNNGTRHPFNDVSGSDITTDAHGTMSVALGDVDGDGDLDLVAGNNEQVNRLYLNQGSGVPWTPNWISSDIVAAHTHHTFSVALGDVDGDGDIDLVAGNWEKPNQLYLNGGAGAPWTPNWTASQITPDERPTNAVALGDVDGDGDLDMVEGNATAPDTVNYLYLNAGSGALWTPSWISSTITSDAHLTRDVALSDVDSDGDLDLVAGNSAGGVNRLYLNKGSGAPWTPNWTGSDISGDTSDTWSVALGDVDLDGNLDLVVGNMSLEAKRLYLNNGTDGPFDGVSGSDISSDADRSLGAALGDVDGDGDLDLVVGNGGYWDNQANRLYLNTSVIQNHMVCRAHTNGNHVNALAEEGELVWAGTEGGVVRWNRTDGSYIKYTTVDGLPYNDVRAIAIDGAGTKWFGTTSGVTEYDGTNWTTYTTADGLAGKYVRAIAVDGVGHKWIGTDGSGVSLYDGAKWWTYTTGDGLVNNRVNAIAIDGAGHRWFGTRGGVSEFDGATWTTYTTTHGLASDLVYAIAIDGAGHKWFGTDAGVSEYDGVIWTTYTTTHGLASDYVYSIAIDGTGTKWFGTAWGGVSEYDGTTWTTHTIADGIALDYVKAIAIDGDDHKWFGTLRGGISEYSGTTWTTYATADGLADNDVYSIAIDGAGHTWFGSLSGGVGGGVSEYDGTNWITYTEDDGLVNNSVFAIAIDGGGPKWFGTRRGVSEYDGANWTTYTTTHGLADDFVRTIAIDGAGHKWFGTDSDGVSEYDGTDWTTYTTADGLAGNGVDAIAIDGAGHKWFGTGSGASEFEGTNWTTYTTAHGLAGNSVNAIAFDRAGHRWFGTSDGVSEFDGTNWTTYTSADGLVTNNVGAIAIDGDGHKWFGTFRGVSEFDGTDWTTYTSADGLADNNVYAIAIDGAGHKWFGTLNGVSECFSGTPDLTVTKTNNVGGSLALGQAWDWRLAVANEGSSYARFAAGQTILRDQLPSEAITYGAASVENASNVADPGNIACSISGNDLVCTASGGPVTIAAEGGSFEVVWTATASAAGSFANPGSGGACTVDPSDLIGEVDESNNDCDDTIVVTEQDEGEHSVYLPFVRR